jgi:hypothetical protein
MFVGWTQEEGTMEWTTLNNAVPGKHYFMAAVNFNYSA